MEVILRLGDLFEPHLQLGYLFSLDSELLTAVEAMNVVYVLEPTQVHPEECAAPGVRAFERYLLFFCGHSNVKYTLTG